MRILLQFFLSRACISVAAAIAASGGVRGAVSSDTAFFEAKIRPLLVKHCLDCHGAKKHKGGLRLDSRAGWQTGGDSGPAIVPRKPNQSLLIKAVRYQDQELAMPPSGKLGDAEISALTDWVAIGAPDPRDTAETRAGPIDRQQASRHWAFQQI